MGQCNKNPQEMGAHDASPSQPGFQTSADLEKPFPTSPLTLPKSFKSRLLHSRPSDTICARQGREA